MSKIGIIVAMQKEWDALFADKKGEGFFIGKRKNCERFVAQRSGIGKVNAAVTAYSLIAEHNVTSILSFGCAGGSNYDVHVGDVVVGDEYMYYDVYCGSPNAVGQIQGCPPTFPSSCSQWSFLKECKHGLIATGDTFVETEHLLGAITQSLYPEHCPLAIDMESAAIAQVCCMHGIPFTSVRVISDNPFLKERTYETFWEEKDKTLHELFMKFLEGE